MKVLQRDNSPQNLFGAGSRQFGIAKHLIWLHYFAEINTTWPGIKDYIIESDVALKVLSRALYISLRYTNI